MSWSASAKGNRHAIDGEWARALRSAKHQVEGHPPSQKILRVHESAVAEFLLHVPHQSHVGIATSGHFNHDGTGSASLQLSVGAEVPEVAPETAAPSVTPEEALLEHHDAPTERRRSRE